MEPIYDIYLVYGCATPPDWELIAQHLAEPADEDLQARMCERRSGFLGLDLPEQHTAAVLRELHRQGANGSVIEARYRKPQVTVEQALPVAEQEIARLIVLREKAKPPVAFESVRFHSEAPMYWVFKAPSPELMAREVVPGALFAWVDKLDGHVWTNEEFERFVNHQKTMLGMPGSAPLSPPRG